MYLYETIIKELDEYPASCFVQDFKPFAVSLEITKCCTNTCAHCTNYASPKRKEQLSLRSFKTIVDQALGLNIHDLMIWGGEPFLHKDFYAVLEYCLSRGMSISLGTNAYWAKTEQAVRDFINRFRPLLKDNQIIRFETSCDCLHQAQKATPLENVANLVSVLEEKHTGFERYHIRSVIMDQDNTFNQLLEILQKRQANIDLNNVRKNHMNLVLERFVGRAKKLTIQDSSEHVFVSRDVSESVPLYVTASGDVVLYENWVGETIYPLGNIQKRSLREMIAKLNQQRLLKLYHFYPRKYFFYPFRKYVDINKLFPQVDFNKTDQINNPVFLRNEIAYLMQIRQKQFDKTSELRKARKIYSGTNKISAEKCLKIIEHYGDFSDVMPLHLLNTQINDYSIQQKIKTLLTIEYAGLEYFKQNETQIAIK